jgi:hypothetical protein
MITPLVKFDLREFNRDFKDRTARSHRAKDVVINDMALRCAKSAFAACPVGDRAKIDAMLTQNGTRKITHSAKTGKAFKKERTIRNFGGQARNIIVGSYVKAHGKFTRGGKYIKGSGTTSGLDLSFGGSVSKAAKTLVGRRVSHLYFLKSRFVKGMNDIAKYIGKPQRNSKFKDDYSYGKPARSLGIGLVTRCILFAAWTYKTEKGTKTQTVQPAGQAKMDAAMQKGMLEMQNDWRKYAHEKLQAALNKTN